MRRRQFLGVLGGLAAAGGSLAERRAQGQDKGQKESGPKYRVVDTHLHLFNTALEGTGGVPRYMTTPATVEDALAAMTMDRCQGHFSSVMPRPTWPCRFGSAASAPKSWPAC